METKYKSKKKKKIVFDDRKDGIYKNEINIFG